MEKCELDVVDGDFPVLVYKKNECAISNFNQGVDSNKENSSIQSNQIGVIRDKGLLYCFDDKNIYFFTNSNLKLLLQDQNTLSKEDMLIYSFEDKIKSVFSSEQFLYTLHIKDNKSIVNVFDIKDVINKRTSVPSITFNYPFPIKDIQLLNSSSYTQFVVLNENKALCIYDKENNLATLSSQCITFKVNQKGNQIVFLDTEIKVFTNTSTPQKIYSLPLSEILVENEKIIFVDMVKQFIVLYGIDTTEERQDDKIHFVDMTNKKVFTNENFEFPETEEVSNFKNEPAIVSSYLEESEIYVICCKQYYMMNSYFSITDDSVKQLMVEDDYKLTALFKDQDRNTLIAFNYIDFKFEGYDSEQEIINSINYVTPPLGLLLNFDGRMRVYSFAKEMQPFDLKELNYSWVTDNCMGKYVKVQLPKKEEKKITKEDTLKNEIVKKNTFIKKYDERKENKNKEEEDILRKEKINVIRNRFIRKLKFQIDANLQILKDNYTVPTLDKKLQELNTTLDSFSQYSSQFTEVLNKSKEFLQNKSTLYNSIQKSKEDIVSFKNSIISLKSRKKEIENIVTKINNMNISDNASLEEILNSQLMEEFFGKEKCSQMIKIFKEVNLNYDIIQSQKELYSKLINIYSNFDIKLKNISKEYRKAVNYSKMLNKYSLNQSNQINRKVFSEKTQNDMFVNYMKILEELLFDLVCFYENNLKEKVEALQNRKQNQLIKLNQSSMMLTYKSKLNELNLFEMTTLAKRNNIVSINPIEKLNKILINGKSSVTYPDKTEAINIEEFFTGKVTEKEEEKEDDISIEKLNEIENLEKEMKKIEEQNKKNKEATEKYIEEIKTKEKKQKEWEESVEKRIDDINRIRKNNVDINKQNETLYKLHRDMLDKGKETSTNLKKIKEQFDKEKKKTNISLEKEIKKEPTNNIPNNKVDIPKNKLFKEPTESKNNTLFPFQQDKPKEVNKNLFGDIEKKEDKKDKSNPSTASNPFTIPNTNSSKTNPFGVKKEENKKENDNKDVKATTSIFGNFGLGDTKKENKENNQKNEEKPKENSNPFVNKPTQTATGIFSNNAISNPSQAKPTETKPTQPPLSLFNNQPQAKPTETKPTITTDTKSTPFSSNNTPATNNLFTSSVNTLPSTAKPRLFSSNLSTNNGNVLQPNPVTTTNPIQPTQTNTQSGGNIFAQKGGNIFSGNIFNNPPSLMNNLGQTSNPIPQAQNTNPIQMPSFGGSAKLGGGTNPFGAPTTIQPGIFSFGSHINNSTTANTTSPFANTQSNSSPFANPQPNNSSPFANPSTNTTQSGFASMGTGNFFNSNTNNNNTKQNDDFF